MKKKFGHFKELVENVKKIGVWGLKITVSIFEKFLTVKNGPKIAKLFFSTLRPRDLSYGSKSGFKLQITSFWTFRIRFTRFRRKRPKVDASIFRLGAESYSSLGRAGKTEENSMDILAKFSSGQVSSPRLYRLKFEG